MTRSLLPGFALLTVACGYPPLDRLCVDQPASACAQEPPADAACPAFHLAPGKVTPSIELLIDRSASMVDTLAGQVPKYTAVQNALVGSQGVVTQLEQQVYFGAALYSDDAPCPKLYSEPRALNNHAKIGTLIASQAPRGNTPTPPAIDAIVADFLANPPPAGSPPIIVLATDGLPNQCGDSTVTTQAQSVAAAASAYAAGIPLFVLSVGDTTGTAAHFQALANAGQGIQPGQPEAPYYPVTTPAQLLAAFQTIIGGTFTGARSCDLKLSSAVDATGAQRGSVTLNGATLTYGTDWVLDGDGITLHLVGNACTALKGSAAPVLDATFPCPAGQ